MNSKLSRLPLGSLLAGFARFGLAGCCLLIGIRSACPADPARTESTIETPPAAEILRGLYAEHPRLIARSNHFVRLRAELGRDETLKRWWAKIQGEADKALTSPPVKYEIPDGLRLLGVSRTALNRAYTLGLAWKLTGDRRYPERLEREMEAVAGFRDWNPRHFLDTAEMAHAMAIAYDWCFDFWSADRRATMRRALVEKALEPARAIYRAAPEKGGWPMARHNWNQVCNGGITLGSLAIADEAPELASELVASACRSIQRAMAEFAPDGAYPEGPGYWNYGVIYNVAFLAALESALGKDFGLSGAPGFSETGRYVLHITGPLGKTFNYADGRDGLLRAPQMFWLARRFDQPALAAYEAKAATPHALDLLWYDAPMATAPANDEPLDRYFRGPEVVTLRSAWDQPGDQPLEGRRAIYVGFKAGDNKANHSHLDLGSFVLDALGSRWAVDLGGENYNVPGYFGKQRWDYYLTRAEGHNTLVLNPDSGPDQDPSAFARISKFQSMPDQAWAVADLTPAYAKRARHVARGIALRDARRRVVVQDEIEADQPIDIHWFMHTPALVEVRGLEANLTLGQQRLWVALLGTPGSGFSIEDPVPLPTSPKSEGQTSVRGKKLTIRFRQVREARYAVVLIPLLPGENPPARADLESSLLPLSERK